MLRYFAADSFVDASSRFEAGVGGRAAGSGLPPDVVLALPPVKLGRPDRKIPTTLFASPAAPPLPGGGAACSAPGGVRCCGCGRG